jgi:replicative DNA helicase
MNDGEANLTAAEQAAFGRVVETFGPDVTIGEFQPWGPDNPRPPKPSILERPDAILPELEPVPLPPQMTDGLAFAQGATSSDAAIWGKGGDSAWSPGEAFGIVGPDGVGKTTLAQRIILALAGVEPTVLGLNVEPAAGHVIYVAADRPKQAQRSLWRMLPGIDRRGHGKIRERVLVWQGPLPFDLAKVQPEALAEWVAGFDGSHVILDSLAFVATRLTEDETGSALAQCFMATSVAGIEVCWLGHPRKASGENKKPNTLADVYGSRWITAASGSVLSLWASAGDPVVEVRQQKSPAGEVGPFLMEIDHDTGAVSVAEGTDLLGHLRAAAGGLSAKQAARLVDGSSEKAREVKARRRLEGFVSRGLAHRREGAPIRGRIHEPDVYFATPWPGVREGPE